MSVIKTHNVWRYSLSKLQISTVKFRQFSDRRGEESDAAAGNKLDDHAGERLAHKPTIEQIIVSQPPVMPSPELPPSTEYGQIKLSQDNILVDTHALVKAFSAQGFTLEQSECMTYAFTQVLNEALKEQRKVCADKAALDIMREQIMSHVAALRKDLVILEKSELSDLRNENDKLKLLLQQTKSQITEDVSRVKNQLTLDINIERSRAKDDFVATEKSIASLTTKMTAELGTLETTFERYKNDIYKFIAGTLASILTIGLGLYRVMKS